MAPDAIRGFALWNDAAPLVAVNTTFIPQARAFTLFHEIGHLLLRQDAASDEHIGRSASLATGYTVERWCERMAATVLLPEPAVRNAVPTGHVGGRGVRKRPQARQPLQSQRARRRDPPDRTRSRPERALRPSRKPVRPTGPAAKKRGGGGRSAAQTRIAQVGRSAARRIVQAVAANRLSEGDARDILRLGGQGFQDFTSLAETS